MKKVIIGSILVALIAAGTTLRAQDKQEEYLGLPGDNLNLYAVMKLFQQSKTLEEFERNLNDENSHINNLDLNADNMVDYIKVIDNIDGDVHNIVLQDAVGPMENQDVAVITVQRFGNGDVQIQITGDEELYGKDYIIEPIIDNISETPNPGYIGNENIVYDQNITYVRTTPVEIAGWPLVRFIFLPTYTVWHSSWYWGYYPHYWHPWRTCYWHYYYGYHYNWYGDYYGHYRRWNYHRYSRWHDYYYTGRRTFSPDVYHRVEVGTYKTTYSRPDERRNGEAMFAKDHPDQYRRISENSARANNTRRNNSDSRMIERAGGNNNSESRRSSTTVTGKSVTNSSAGRNSTTTKRSLNVVKDKPVSSTPSENRAVAPRRSVTTETRKNTDNNSSAGQSVTRSKTTTVKSSARRDVKVNKAESARKSNNQSKESENKDKSRRK